MFPQAALAIPPNEVKPKAITAENIIFLNVFIITSYIFFNSLLKHK
jgi:hypothetical protein